jgi:hypothetical protein
MHGNCGSDRRRCNFDRGASRLRREDVSCKAQRDENLSSTQIKGETIMDNTQVVHPKAVSRAEWLVARKELLERENELTRLRDELKWLSWLQIKPAR